MLLCFDQPFTGTCFAFKLYLLSYLFLIILLFFLQSFILCHHCKTLFSRDVQAQVISCFIMKSVALLCYMFLFLTEQVCTCDGGGWTSIYFWCVRKLPSFSWNYFKLPGLTPFLVIQLVFQCLKHRKEQHDIGGRWRTIVWLATISKTSQNIFIN